MFCIALAAVLIAHDPGAPGEADGGLEREDHHILQTVVEAPAPTPSASAESIPERDLALRPRATPEDILRAVPGLVLAQHQGGGKADQLFLRGFDADHGTDVALYIDGAPINLPSHGHGQGYADLNFLIPEAIDRIDLSKGPYFAEYGDFDTAGAVNLRTRRAFDESSVSATYGSFDTYRVLGIASPGMSEALPWLAAEVYGTNGPFQNPEGLQRYNVFAKDTLALSGTTTLSVLGSAYGSQWSASGQIPLRAVSAGLLDPFGSIDPSEGGQTQRQMLIATLEERSGPNQLSLSAYAVRSQARLFSDFTFQLRDPVHFDEIEQDDQRTVTGLNARYRRTRFWGGVVSSTTLGAQARYDDIRTGLFHDQQRQRLPDCFGPPGSCDDAWIGESNLAAYAEEDLRIGTWFRAVAGVRADLFEFNVADQLPIPATPPPAPTSGVAQRSIVSPKLQVVFRPHPIWDLYLDGGGGFHSNDARAVIATSPQGSPGALARAWGGEVGTRLHLLGRVDFAVAVWDLYLQSEQVFDADIDSTVASDPTNRYGVDFEARWEILPWLWANADLNFAHAAFTVDRGNGTAVALAPTRTASAGVSAIHPSGFKGRIGMRYVGDRPATPDGSLIAQGYTLFDATVGYRHKWWELGLVIENIFNTSWREAQFAAQSQLVEAPYDETQPVTDIQFTPGNPINVRVTASAYF